MAEFPEWYDGKHVNEVKFCEEFLREHPMKSVNGTFFTVEGRVTDEDKLRREIYEMLKPYFSTGLGKRVNNLLDALRLEAYAPDLLSSATASTSQTARFSSTGRSATSASSAATVYRWHTIPTRPHRQRGSNFSASYCIRRTSQRCRSSWATASCPRRRVRKC